MLAEQVAPPINESFALRAPEILARIPGIVYVGKHGVNCKNPSVFAIPQAAFSSAWVQLTHSHCATNHIVGIKRDGEDFGMQYSEYLDAFTRMSQYIKSISEQPAAAVDMPRQLNGEPLKMDCISVGRIYFVDEIGPKSIVPKLNDLARVLGIQQPTEQENHSEPLEHLTTISLYPTVDYARFILDEAKRAQENHRKMNHEERASLAHLQTCIPYSESQLAAHL